MKIIILLLALAAGGWAQNPNATARFLAGLPLEGTDLANFSQVPAWRKHAKEMDYAWNQSERRQMQQLRAWAPVNLGAIHSSQAPVFYFFSGPDILYAQALFPNAGTYVLCAKEPVGQVSDPAQVPAEELPSAMIGLRNSLISLLNFSFFITQDLRVDLQQRHFTGILPVLQILLARSGATILSVETISCDMSGAVVIGARKGTPGARIRFTHGAGGQQTLFYFAGDISNGGLGAHGGVLKLCERLGRGNSLLKAASYLPHEGGFSRIRDWILSRSRVIVQDPSGIPFHHFDPAQWNARLWGNHGKPIELFAKYPQPALETALAATPRPALPFGFGYQHLPSNAVMIVAERQRGPVAADAEAGGLRR